MRNNDNLHPDVSVDEILEDLSSKYDIDKQDESGSKIWSLDEIDSLLGIDKPAAEKKEPADKPVKDDFQKSAFKSTVVYKPEQLSMDQDTQSGAHVYDSQPYKDQRFDDGYEDGEIEFYSPVFDDDDSSDDRLDLTDKLSSISAESEDKNSDDSADVQADSDTKKFDWEPPFKRETDVHLPPPDSGQDPHANKSTAVLDKPIYTNTEPAPQYTKDKSAQKNGSVRSKLGTLFNSVFNIKESDEYIDIDDIGTGSETVGDDPKIREDAYEPVKAVDEPAPAPANQQNLADIRPIYNKDIKHSISTKMVERSIPSGKSAMESDKYRTKFINPPTQRIEKTGEYELNKLGKMPEPVDRPGMMIKKKKITNTADLEPIPTIIAAEDLAQSDTKVLGPLPGNDALSPDEIAGQIKLTGFDEKEETVKIDEDLAQKELKSARSEKLKKFKLTDDLDGTILDEPDADEALQAEDYDIKNSVPFMSEYIDDEYEKPSDKARILSAFSRAGKFNITTIAAQALVFVFSVALYAVSGVNEFMFGNSVTGLILVNMFLILIAGVFGISTIVKGISGIISRKPNTATGAALVFVVCLLQCIILIFSSHDAFLNSVIYAPIACFSLLISSISRYINLKRALNNFEFSTNGTKMHSTEKISEEDDALEIGRGLLMGEPDIR
ncbi:MAG: hypothetical protein LBH71_01480, partial [Oscillospiraceae bacterium]|nr:hypothetical protein [Oscillospiraceae bacterium]